MSRIAALYDIHGNLAALDAVLEEMRRLGVEQVVIGGDVVPGPMPHETLARLRELDIPAKFIRGNGEIAVLEELSGKIPAGVPAQYQPIIQWTAQQLTNKDQEWLREWPRTVRLALPGAGDVLFCHATPRDENEIFTRDTAEEKLLPVFDGIDAGVVVCGHTHMQFDRMVGKIRVVNAGSVGMPFGEPGAHWLVLGPDLELRRSNYDRVKAARSIRGTDYPQAQEFAENNVLNAPTEARMLEIFTRAELK